MTTSQNDHAAVAGMNSLPDVERQVEATLAIAYEARTANMLELYKASRLWDSAVSHAEFGYSIKARLDAEQ